MFYSFGQSLDIKRLMGRLNERTSQIHVLRLIVGQEQGIGTIKSIMPPIVRTGDAIRQQLDTKSVLLSQQSPHASGKG